MILIISSLGATKKYLDRGMMEKTFGGFINSLRRQTDKDFRLFISHHDRPDMKADDDFIEWCPMLADKECEYSKVLESLPKSVFEEPVYKEKPYDHPLADMGRKTRNSVVEAMRWANSKGIKNFWVLRIDSDDLLARDFIENIHCFEKDGIRAVYNKKCHMFDIKKREVGVCKHPYSTTCNALKYEIDEDGIPKPDWFYHIHDHTYFHWDVKRDEIASKEIDYTLCIVTNSGNSISGRSEIERERWTKKISLEKDIIERYGLDYF